LKICYDAPVRTTVDIDPDLAARLRTIAKERGISFKEALNMAVRGGLLPGSGATRPYKVQARSMGLRPGLDIDRALQLASALEDEQTMRELELRK
jgi:hypothetical protein